MRTAFINYLPFTSDIYLSETKLLLMPSENNNWQLPKFTPFPKLLGKKSSNVIFQLSSSHIQNMTFLFSTQRQRLKFYTIWKMNNQLCLPVTEWFCCCLLLPTQFSPYSVPFSLCPVFFFQYKILNKQTKNHFF